MADTRVQRKLAAILAADVVGYSRMIEADEEGARARLRTLHEELIDPRIASDGGRIFKTMGDGILVEYPSVVDAVRNAIQIQEAIHRNNAGLAEADRINFRVGINVGDVMVEGNDIHGNGVNVAARLEGLCEPGGVYVSGSVYDHVVGNVAASFESLGEKTVKNITKPVPVYRVVAQNAASGAPVDAGEGLAVPGKPSIAVLPFQNLSGDPDQEYFADGISEDIITALSRIRWFFVIARNTTFTYKGKSVDVQRVASELGVRYVLEGSVRKAGNRVRITAQLIDGATGNHLWAERYDREIEDIFAVQDEITANIAGALEPQILVAESVRSQRVTEQNLDAWDLVIRATTRIGEFSHSGSADALQLLDRAIAIDPAYALALSHKSWVLVWRALQGWDDMPTALDTATAAAEDALRHDADEPWAYIAWCFISVVIHDSHKQFSSARRAIELNPNFALAHSHFGLAHTCNGNGVEGMEWIDKARRLSPRDIFRDEFDLHASFAQFQAANYEQAAMFAVRSSMPRPEHVYPHLIAAASHAHCGNAEAAQEEVSTVMRFAPEYSLAMVKQRSVFLVDDDRARFLGGLRQAGLPE